MRQPGTFWRRIRRNKRQERGSGCSRNTGHSPQAQLVQGAYDEDNLSKAQRESDYWKPMEDGSLEYDRDGWLKDPNGNFILDDEGNRIGANGVQEGLQEILGIDAFQATAMLRDQGFELRDDGTYWTHDGNNGASITLENGVYASVYNQSLSQHNTRNIYDRLVAQGLMDTTEPVTLGLPSDQWDGRQPDASVISYEQWKERNFITGEPNLHVNNIMEGSEITTIFGATGSFSRNPHRGADFSVPSGTPVHSMFGGNTRFNYGGNAPERPTGNFQETATMVTYTFKGERRSDTILTRYLHLQSRNTALSANPLILSNTQLGFSGNTGTWPGVSPYGEHLHVDVRTERRSPLLESLLNDAGQQIEHGGKYYFDPFIFLNPEEYSFTSNAQAYGTQR